MSFRGEPDTARLTRRRIPWGILKRDICESQHLLRSFHRCSCMVFIWPGEPGQIKSYDFISDKLINIGIGLDEDFGCYPVKTIHQAAELAGAHLLGKAR